MTLLNRGMLGCPLRTVSVLRSSNERSEMGVSYPMKPMVTDELWEEIKPLLPPHPPRPRGRRPPSSDRAALEGILYVLCSGIPWELLSAVFGDDLLEKTA